MEFEIELERLLSEDRELHSFTPQELGVIFSAWYEKGDKLWLAETLREHPDWEKIAWRQLVRIYADYQDYRQAYETAQRFVAAPELPKANSLEPLDKLATRFQINRTDLDDGLALYFAQLKEGQIDAALVTLRELIALRGSPKYLWYLEAQLWAQKGEWQKAWRALSRFEFGPP